MNDFAKSVDVVLKELETTKEGLSAAEASARLQKYGPNTLKEKKKISPFAIFLNQFKSFIVAILIGATIISSVLGYREFLHEGGSLFQHMIDPLVIFIILMLNAVFGFVQEYNAEKSIEALKKLTSLKAKLIRGGKEVSVDAAEVVPGDILDLEEGDKIPADARVFESINLETQEASLTGESTPVEKSDVVLKEGSVIGDRKNMVFSSTIITKGRGKAVVTATGMSSEIGKIAGLIEEGEEELTPLQLKLKDLGKWLGLLTIAICIFVFAFGSLRTGQYIEMFMAAIALAVAAIPEGLPAVVTISLALGVKRMIKRNALVRRLPSVETLGCTTVICSDKTGTLTKNEMTVQKIFVNDEVVNVTGSGYETKGKFSSDPNKFKLLLQTGALCNDSNLEDGKVIGDPTEAALIVSAAKAGLEKEKLEKEFPRVGEIPFDSKRKLMTTIHQIGSKQIAFTKGAPDVILGKCTRIYLNGKVMPLTKDDARKITEANENFAKSALRVLGFACQFLKGEKASEEDLIFVGLQGMIDPPREEAKLAIAKCKQAGIKVVMITGDHRLTAEAVGRHLGLTGKVLTGQDIETMTDLHKIVEEVSIYARVSPEHKMKIIEALRKNGHVVAMTGDGVNDAPALKDADIGIAMGITGTDVAKEASDMVLTDDNFASIVNAVEEGRNIYDNIKKFVQYLLSSNLGEVFTIFTAIMLGLPLPLIALQILWINLMTDGLPALALGIDPAEPNIMGRQPRKSSDNIVNKHRAVTMFLIGIVMMVSTLGIFTYYNHEKGLSYARTIAFTTLMMLQMFNVINCRSESMSSFRVKPNYWLYGAILTSLVLQIIVIYTPLGPIFQTTPIAAIDWLYVFLVSASVLAFGEFIKLFHKVKA